MTPQKANIHLKDILASAQTILGSYRLRSRETNIAVNMTPADEADNREVEMTSTMERPRTEAATAISPVQITFDRHELFRELGISILRNREQERGLPSGKIPGYCVKPISRSCPIQWLCQKPIIEFVEFFRDKSITSGKTPSV